MFSKNKVISSRVILGWFASDWLGILIFYRSIHDLVHQDLSSISCILNHSLCIINGCN